MFERPGEREKKQECGPLTPGADACAASSDRKHQKMDIDGALLQPLPDLMDGKPTSCEISEDKAGHRKWLRPEDIRAQAEHAAQDGGDKLRLPFIDFIGVFQELDIALDDPWQRDVSPAPELWCGRACDTRDRGGAGVVLDGDLLAVRLKCDGFEGRVFGKDFDDRACDAERSFSIGDWFGFGRSAHEQISGLKI